MSGPIKNLIVLRKLIIDPYPPISLEKSSNVYSKNSKSNPTGTFFGLNHKNALTLLALISRSNSQAPLMQCVLFS